MRAAVLFASISAASLWAACLWAACLWAASSAAAQEVPPDPPAETSPEDPDANRRAHEHFDAGMRAYDEHDYRAAIEQFSLASSLVPSADLWFNIARAYEQLSEYDAAIEHYQRYLRDRVDPPDRADVEAHIEDLRREAEAARLAASQRATTGTLRIQGNIDGASVALDGRAIGRTPIASAITLAPGPHRVQVTHAGRMPFEAVVNVEAGVQTAAFADLAPLTEYRTIRGTPIFTWIVGGLAVASLGTAIAFGAVAGGYDTNTPGGMADAIDAGAVSDVFLGSAIGLAVGAIALYFLESQAQDTERVQAAEPAE
jgi:hypothetical protein